MSCQGDLYRNACSEVKEVKDKLKVQEEEDSLIKHQMRLQLEGV